MLLSFIPRVLMNAKMMRDKKEYAKLPLKMKEVEADYRRKRFYLFLFQIGGIVMAIIGTLG